MQKEILGSITKLLISKLIPSALLMLINVIYARALSQVDYGIYQVVWTYLNICVVIATFGIPKYIFTFGSKIQLSEAKKFGRIFFAILVLVLFPGVYYFFTFFNYFNSQSSFLFIILLLSQSAYLLQEALVISKNQNSKLILPNVLYAIFLLVAHIIVLQIGYSLNACILGIITVSVLRNLSLWYVSKGAVFPLNSQTSSPSGLGVSLLLWLGMNDVLQLLTKWIDKLFLLYLLPIADYATYFNGTFEVPLVGMLLTSFQTIVTTNSAREIDNGNTVIDLFNSTSYFMSGIVFPFFSWVFLFSTPIVVSLFSSKYEQSSELFAISILLLPVRICSHTMLLQIRNKGKIILTGSILDLLLTMTLMFILYPIYNLNGLALSIVISTYIQVIYYLFETSKVYSISLVKLLPFAKLLLRLLASFLIIWTIKVLTHDLSPFIAMVLGFLGVACLIMYYLRAHIGISFIYSLFGKQKL